MNIRRLAGPTLALTLTLAACDPGGVELETRTFRLESLRPHQASELVEPYVYRDRELNPGTMSVTEGALTVRETTDNLERIARVLEEFDRPVGMVRLRFQVVEANGGAGASPEIAAIEEELRKLFKFEGYRLAGEGVVTVTDGDFRQRLTGGADGWYATGGVYRIGQDAFRLDEVRLHFRQEQLFETSVNVRLGQTLVIGSARSPEGDGAVILVVGAERSS